MVFKLGAILKHYECQIFLFNILNRERDERNKTRVNSGYAAVSFTIYRLLKTLFVNFWKFDFSNFKMTFAKFLMKTTLFFNDKFSKFLKCFFDKVLPCGNFRQCNDGPLNIFPILHKKAFSFFNYSETSKQRTPAGLKKSVRY